MAAYRIEVRRSVERSLRHLPADAQDRLLEAMLTLADEPRPHQAKPLTGDLKGLWSVRVGRNWRIVYEVDDEAGVVRIERAGWRRDVY